MSVIPKGKKLYIIHSAFVSPIHTFSLAGNIIVYTPIQGASREKYFYRIIYKGKMPTLAGNYHLFLHFFLHRPRLFHLSPEEVRVQSVRNRHQSGYFRDETINKNINKKSKRFSMRGN